MAETFPSVAVVILNWNGRKFLEEFLPSVVRTDYPNLRIYVADNASTDDSMAFVERAYPAITRISNGGNLGFAEGYNQALGAIQADYYVLLNQDVAVEPDWIRPLVALMEANPRAGACQPKIRARDQPDHFEYAGAAGGWIDRWGYAFCRGRIFDHLEADRGQYDAQARVFWATGAALCIRAELYHRAGGLDAYFFAHMEEIDLCWRVQRMGYEVWCCPASVVYHVGGGSLPRGNSRKTFLNYRNNLIMLHKNLRGVQRWATLLVRLTLDGIAGARSLVKGEAGETRAILRAHKGYYGWLFGRHRREYNIRDVAPPRRAFARLNGVYPGSLVWQYFIRGKKTFSSLDISEK
jgi:GT2 family glycosyltransferase